MKPSMLPRLNIRFALLISLLLVSIFAAPVAAETVFVDDDYPLAGTPDGSSRRPFRSIHEALAAARAIRDGGSNAAIVIHVAPGVYVGGFRIDRSKIKLMGSTQFTYDQTGRPIAPLDRTEAVIVPGEGGVEAPLGNTEALCLIVGQSTLTDISVEGMVLDGRRSDLGTLTSGGVIASDVTDLVVRQVLARQTGIGFVLRYSRGQIDQTAVDATMVGYFLQGGADANVVMRRSRSTGLVSGFYISTSPDHSPHFDHPNMPQPAEFRLNVNISECMAVGHNNGGYQIIPRSPITADFARPTHLVVRITGSTATSPHPNSLGLRIRGFNPALDLALKTVNLTLEDNNLAANAVVASATGANLANFQVSITDITGTLAAPAFNYALGTVGGGGWTAAGTMLLLNGIQLAP